ncbi:MAG: hypothetical protein F2654_09815 [Actinobacteria bacterium]|nr:hypothetical protein [Actinomycetota bacterium]
MLGPIGAQALPLPDAIDGGGLVPIVTPEEMNAIDRAAPEPVEELINRAVSAAEEPGVVVFVRMGMGEEIARALGGQAPVDGEPPHPLREYGVGAQILKDLGVRRMILMSNTRPNVLPGLDGYGLTVEGWRRIDGE